MLRTIQYLFTPTIILTWLYNNTKGSLVVILAHFSFNLGSNLVVNLLGLVNSQFYNIIGGIAGVFYLVLIIAGFGYKRFSKLSDSELPIDIQHMVSKHLNSMKSQRK